MPVYQQVGGWRIWQADSADALAEAMRRDLAPAQTTEDFIRTWPDRTALRPGQTVRPVADAVNAADAANWLADSIKAGWITKAPHFDDIVKVILATFTVFTGLTLTRFLAPPGLAPIDIAGLEDWHWWGIFALVALLLRYVIGSAIHLNYLYGGDPPRSVSVLLLFKDLMFLVLFGMLAFFIVEAPDAEHFIARAMLFALGGFIWSIVDYFARRFWCVWVHNDQGDYRGLKDLDSASLVVFILVALWVVDFFLQWEDIVTFLERAVAIVVAGLFFCAINWAMTPDDMPEREWPGRFWRVWVCLDGLQFFATGALLLWLQQCHDELRIMILLAVGYIAFLLADMFAMITAVQHDVK